MEQEAINKMIREYEDLSTINMQLVIKTILKDGEKTRDELCEELGFHINTNDGQYERRTTVYNNLERLEERGIISRLKEHNGKRGRPKIYWKLDKE